MKLLFLKFELKSVRDLAHAFSIFFPQKTIMKSSAKTEAVISKGEQTPGQKNKDDEAEIFFFMPKSPLVLSRDWLLS